MIEGIAFKEMVGKSNPTVGQYLRCLAYFAFKVRKNPSKWTNFGAKTEDWRCCWIAILWADLACDEREK